MDKKTKTIITFVGSICIFAVGIFRIFFEYLPSMSLSVAYIFAITGLIGAIVDSVILTKANWTK